MKIKDYEDYVEFRWKPPVVEKENAMLAYTAMCMAGEAGETADAVKKLIKGAADDISVLLEVGDTFYYLTALIHQLGFNWAEVLDMNKTKLDGRNKAP